MSDSDQSDFHESERVRVLLAEHGTLRSEIIALTTLRFQLYTLGGAVTTILSALYIRTFGVLPNWLFAVLFASMLAFIGIAFSIMFRFIWRDIQKAASRIREIELDVNDRVGEDLLVWENLWGG